MRFPDWTIHNTYALKVIALSFKWDFDAPLGITAISIFLIGKKLSLNGKYECNNLHSIKSKTNLIFITYRFEEKNWEHIKNIYI